MVYVDLSLLGIKGFFFDVLQYSGNEYRLIVLCFRWYDVVYGEV